MYAILFGACICNAYSVAVAVCVIICRSPVDKLTGNFEVFFNSIFFTYYFFLCYVFSLARFLVWKLA